MPVKNVLHQLGLYVPSFVIWLWNTNPKGNSYSSLSSKSWSETESGFLLHFTCIIQTLQLWSALH